jgi:hypothetical protein
VKIHGVPEGGGTARRASATIRHAAAAIISTARARRLTRRRRRGLLCPRRCPPLSSPEIGSGWGGGVGAFSSAPRAAGRGLASFAPSMDGGSPVRVRILAVASWQPAAGEAAWEWGVVTRPTATMELARAALCYVCVIVVVSKSITTLRRFQEGTKAQATTGGWDRPPPRWANI